MSRPSLPEIRECMLRMATQRGVSKSLCPSEVARALGGSSWRDSMTDVREVAYALQRDGQIDVLQQGQLIDPDNARGPIRLRLRP